MKFASLQQFAFWTPSAFFLTVLLMPSRDWTAQDLFNKADSVIICTASTPVPVDNTDEFFPDYLQQLESTLQVSAVFKGDPNLKVAQLVHFEYRQDVRNTPGNGPTFIVLGTEARSSKGGPPQKPQYLVFVRLRKDGRFEPVTGNVDPNPSVIRLLLWPEADPALGEGTPERTSSK
jgi:hypothetical protein